MPILMDYVDYSVHITSPTTEVTAQELINAIRELSATEVGIMHPTLAISSGKESLGAGVQTALTVALIDPWQLEPYAGVYTLTISGGNVVSLRPDGDIVRYVPGGPQVEILRSASATIVATGSGVLPADITAIADAVRANLSTELARVDAPVSGVPAAVGARVIEGTKTADEIIRISFAPLAGKRQGLGTATEEYMAQDGITPRVTFTPDAQGNGTPTLNGAP